MKGNFWNSEDDFQSMIFKLHQLCKNYKIKISKEKTKNVAFIAKKPNRAKSVLDNKIFKWVSDFKYLGCDTSFYKNGDR